MQVLHSYDGATVNLSRIVAPEDFGKYIDHLVHSWSEINPIYYVKTCMGLGRNKILKQTLL